MYIHICRDVISVFPRETYDGITRSIFDSNAEFVEIAITFSPVTYMTINYVIMFGTVVK